MPVIDAATMDAAATAAAPELTAKLQSVLSQFQLPVEGPDAGRVAACAAAGAVAVAVVARWAQVEAGMPEVTADAVEIMAGIALETFLGMAVPAGG